MTERGERDPEAIGVVVLVCVECGREHAVAGDPAGDATRGDLHGLDRP